MITTPRGFQTLQSCFGNAYYHFNSTLLTELQDLACGHPVAGLLDHYVTQILTIYCYIPFKCNPTTVLLNKHMLSLLITLASPKLYKKLSKGPVDDPTHKASCSRKMSENQVTKQLHIIITAM